MVELSLEPSSGASAIVAATAMVKGIPLFTGDKDFKALGKDVRIVLYEP